MRTQQISMIHLLCSLAELMSKPGYIGGFVIVAALAEKSGLSVSYIEQLIVRLRRAGIIVTARGPGGGYRLNVDPTKLPLSRVLAISGGQKLKRSCYLIALERELHRAFDGVPLSRLVEACRGRG